MCNPYWSCSGAQKCYPYTFFESWDYWERYKSMAQARPQTTWRVIGQSSFWFMGIFHVLMVLDTTLGHIHTLYRVDRESALTYVIFSHTPQSRPASISMTILSWFTKVSKTLYLLTPLIPHLTEIFRRRLWAGLGFSRVVNSKETDSTLRDPVARTTSYTPFYYLGLFCMGGICSIMVVWYNRGSWAGTE